MAALPGLAATAAACRGAPAAAAARAGPCCPAGNSVPPMRTVAGGCTTMGTSTMGPSTGLEVCWGLLRCCCCAGLDAAAAAAAAASGAVGRTRSTQGVGVAMCVAVGAPASAQAGGLTQKLRACPPRTSPNSHMMLCFASNNQLPDACTKLSGAWCTGCGGSP